MAAGVKVVDMSGDFRLRDAAAYERYYGAKHPHPELLGTFVYGLPELNREAIQAARAVASPGCFATTIELALLPLARAGLLRRRRPRRRHHRLVGQRRRAARGHAPPGPRGQPEDATSRSSTSTARDHRRWRRAGAHRRRAALRAGVGAAVARHLRHLLRRGPGRRDRRDASPALYRAPPTRDEPFVRSSRERLPEVAAVVGLELRRGRLHGGRPAADGDAHAGVLQRDRQPDQGRRRPGDPEHEPDARPGRDGVARGSGAVAVADAVDRSSSSAARCWRRRRAGGGRRRRRARSPPGGALVIVHGGGPQATALSKRLGIEPRMVGGRRDHRRGRRSTS